MCVMLCLLIHSLVAALWRGRNFLVSEFFCFINLSTCIWREQLNKRTPTSYCHLIVTFVSICSGCNLLSRCCNSYEHCVSCCLNPALVISYKIFNFILSFPFFWHHLIEQSEGLNVCFLNLIEQTTKEQVLKMKVAKPASASNVSFYLFTFPFCLVVM